jgi:hypothetical protein
MGFRALDCPYFFDVRSGCGPFNGTSTEPVKALDPLAPQAGFPRGKEGRFRVVMSVVLSGAFQP